MNKLTLLLTIIIFNSPVSASFNPTSTLPNVVKPPIIKEQGNQVLHFSTDNKPPPNDIVKKFIKNNFAKAERVYSDAGVLKYAFSKVTIKDGLFLEISVCTGRTINFIAMLNPLKTIHGFDSFKGLPEEWNQKTWDGGDRIFKKGIFALLEGEKLPEVLSNVKIHIGWPKDTLPTFSKSYKDKIIAFLHIDSCLYSSTKVALDGVGHMINPGTIIVFDEYYNYPTSTEHEYKAFMEFMDRRPDIGFEYIAYNPLHEQVAIRITNAK
jgi:hypothetical protein